MFEQDRFALAGTADDGHGLAGLDCQIGAAQYLVSPEVFVNVDDLDHLIAVSFAYPKMIEARK